jgi:hypothetical protein
MVCSVILIKPPADDFRHPIVGPTANRIPTHGAARRRVSSICDRPDLLYSDRLLRSGFSIPKQSLCQNREGIATNLPSRPVTLALAGWRRGRLRCRPRKGGGVAILARSIGLWWLNACRIVYVVDKVDKFGFAYGTLPDHARSGEERSQKYLAFGSSRGSLGVSKPVDGLRPFRLSVHPFHSLF